MQTFIYFSVVKPLHVSKEMKASYVQTQTIPFLSAEARGFAIPLHLQHRTEEVCSFRVLTISPLDIDIDCHIVREKVTSGLIKLLPISSSMQLADIFTKALSPSIFQGLCSKLGLMNIHSQLAGGS